MFFKINPLKALIVKNPKRLVEPGVIKQYIISCFCSIRKQWTTGSELRDIIKNLLKKSEFIGHSP